MEVTGQVAMVTGAAGGIGGAVARAFCERGARVAALDREAPAPSPYGRTGDWLALACDVTDAEAVARAVQEVESAFGPVTILVNAAAVLRDALLVSFSLKGIQPHDEEAWRRVIDTNLTGTFLATRGVVESMIRKRTRGLVINFSSVTAAGNPGQSAYAAAKSGVEALTTTWAKELGPHGIRVACVAPGFVDTGMTARDLRDDLRSFWVDRTPSRRLGTEEEMVRAVLFVVENDFFNGRVLAVDGGLRL